MSEWCQIFVSIPVFAQTLLWSLSYFPQKTLGWPKGLTIYEEIFSILSQFFSADEESNDHHDGKGGRGSAMHTAQTLFPSTMCSAFVEVIRLLDDHAVSLDGVAVYEIAYQVLLSVSQNVREDGTFLSPQIRKVPANTLVLLSRQFG